MLFDTSPIYLRTLSPQTDANEPQRSHLREAFLRARGNAEYLLAKIQKDFPNLTLHNISHVDSLWEVASVICGNDFPINPMEGFVLGCSFLIHDAALSYDAVGGAVKLRSTDVWKDTFYDANLKVGYTDEEKLKEADFNAIRTLHAKLAGTLCTQTFTRDNGTTFYIIEDDELRNHLQEIIGSIAESHHWNIDRVRHLPTQFNALPGYPRDWRVNPQKLACILRCADAGHIDAGRAPDYLFQLLKLNGVSREHWSAQNKLAVVDIDEHDKHKAVITSTIAFKESDCAAWNVASAAVKVFDTEIKSANHLLKAMPQPCSFQVEEVVGADSVEELSKYIKTEGWEPCEANLRVDDVAGLINKLGGEALYGKEDHILIALRELIQNARDAIKARSFIDKTPPAGGICISVKKIPDGVTVSVSDNGLGMSLDVIKNAFLNFGESYWASSLAKKEFPGLRSSGFTPVGKYGIGFYSVFMIAQNVVVETRRFDAALNEAIFLKFPNGLTLNPIKSTGRGSGTDVSTVVTLTIKDEKYRWNGKYEIRRNQMGAKSFAVPFSKAVSALTAGLDADVFYQENGAQLQRIHQNVNAPDFDARKWLTDISFAQEQNNPALTSYIDYYSKTLEPIKDNGRLVGLAALSLHNFHEQIFLNVSTVGGLATSIHCRNGENYIGFLDSVPSAANRNGELPMKTNGAAIKRWAEGQYSRLRRLPLDKIPVECQSSLHEFNVDPIDIVRLLLVSKAENQLLLYSIENVLRLINRGSQIIILISAFNDNHMETYVDINKVLTVLGPNEFYLYPGYNSSFLDVNLQVKDDDTTLFGCIIRKAQTSGLNLKVERRKNYVAGNFGLCDALVITKQAE